VYRLGVSLLLLFLVCSCSKSSYQASLWLEEIKAKSIQADLALKEERFQDAILALSSIVENKGPQEVEREDVRIVRQDACFRLATIYLEDRNPQEALKWSEFGLGLGQKDDLFETNLLLAKGRALEALGQEQQAAAIYHKALLINEKLLHNVLNLEQENPGGKAH
jgi:tetratricopeptide (TPR) repeat protein